jgi:hypothetical protein
MTREPKMTNEWLKKHRKKVLVHSLILVAFLLYLLFLADPLFDRFEAISDEARPQHLSLPHETYNIQCSIERIDVATQAIGLDGWAFIDGQGSEDSKIYIVLESDKKTYVFDTFPQERPDVTVYFESLNLDLNWSGFFTIIPTRKIESGEYVIGLYITKGDVEALQYTDKAIVKSKGVVKETLRVSRQQQIALPAETRNIRFSIDSVQEMVREEREFVEIEGWAFIDGQGSEDSKIYLVMASNKNTYVFDTMLVKRSDVTAYFAESGLDLDNSGFIARIPKGDIESGTYELGIYIKKDNIQALQYTGKEIKL